MVERGYSSEQWDLMQIDFILQKMLWENEPTVANLRARAYAPDSDFRDESFRRSQRETGNVLESYQVLLIVSSNDRVQGAIVHPRDAKLRALLGGWYISGGEAKRQEASDLDRLIKEHQARLVAF
jgi:hypothetical protein